MDEAERVCHISVLALCALCGFLELVILFTLIFKFYCQKREVEQTQTKFEFDIKWTIIFILATIAITASDFRQLNNSSIYANNSSIYANKFRFIKTIVDSFYLIFFYTIQLYVFLIYQVYSIFKETEYNMSKYTMILVLLLFIVNVSLTLYYLVVVIQVEHTIVDSIDPSILDTFNPLLWIPLISMNILMNVVIMTVMITKLRQIVVTTSIPDPEYNVNSSALHLLSPDSNIINNLKRESTPNALLIDHHGKTYVDIMSKLSVLSAIIVIFNQIFGALLLATVLLTESQSYTQVYTNIIQFISYGMRDVEGFINCFVVYLTFKMNEQMYDKWCCCCHNILQKLFMTNIEKQIKKQKRQRDRNLQFSIDTLTSSSYKVR